MALDLNKYSAAARVAQIKLGKQFGSRHTLNQANQSLNGVKRYATELAAEGFSAKDGETLEGARDGLVSAGVGRDAAKGEKLSTSKAYVEAMAFGLALRMRARSVLDGTYYDLAESDAAGSAEAARVALSVMQQTAVAGGDAEALAKQLDLLAAAFVADGIKEASKARGSDDVVTAIAATAKTLRAANADDTGVAGTPAETQTLDQLDGIIVRLVRRARKAAIAASKNLGNPAIAKAFKLDQLYASRGGAPAEDDGEDDGAGEEGVDAAKPGTPVTP